MPIEADPEAFVAAAQDAINAYDLESTAGVYAPGATLVAITDGAREEHHGAAAIRDVWAGYLAGMRATGFALRKTVTSAAGDILVNTWTSRFADGRTGEGIETWRFDAEGRVAHHAMYTFFDTRASKSLIARARLGFAYPKVALAFLRATRRQGSVRLR